MKRREFFKATTKTAASIALLGNGVVFANTPIRAPGGLPTQPAKPVLNSIKYTVNRTVDCGYGVGVGGEAVINGTRRRTGVFFDSEEAFGLTDDELIRRASGLIERWMHGVG